MKSRKPAVKLSIPQRFKLYDWMKQHAEELQKLDYKTITPRAVEALGFPIVTSSVTEVAKSLEWPPKRKREGKDAKSLSFSARVADLEQRVAGLESQVAKLQQLVLPLQ